jgi:hypothetical protein
LSGRPLPVKRKKCDAKLPVASGSPLPVKADLSGSALPTNYKSIELTNENSSSSSHRARTDDERTTSPFSENQNPKTDCSSKILLDSREARRDWRTPEAERQTMEALHRHRFGIVVRPGEYEHDRTIGTLPDLAIVRKIQANFISLEDEFEWLSDLEERNHGRRIHSYGFYATDASTWHERRALAAEQRKLREDARLETERAKASQQAEVFRREEYEREQHEAMLRCTTVPNCPRCGTKGVICTSEGEAPKAFTWCDCQHVDVALEKHGVSYPEELTRRAADSWEEMRASKLWQRQSDRWAQHFTRKRQQGIDEVFRELEIQFACGSSERREEILNELDVERSLEPATTPKAATEPSIPPVPICQADFEALPRSA